jgi:hypothetical protein
MVAAIGFQDDVDAPALLSVANRLPIVPASQTTDYGMPVIEPLEVFLFICVI